MQLSSNRKIFFKTYVSSTACRLSFSDSPTKEEDRIENNLKAGIVAKTVLDTCPNCSGGHFFSLTVKRNTRTDILPVCLWQLMIQNTIAKSPPTEKFARSGGPSKNEYCFVLFCLIKKERKKSRSDDSSPPLAIFRKM